MQLADADLVLALLARDGPQIYRKYRVDGRCRYEDFYPEGACPWCEAEDRRIDAESG